ncbi:hypothetical protein AQUCO_00400154v1 [Aquilegia coerulea]|uniref:N-acetyltransferase domain-containing protein n=1 Tax=Aquilegia coerulea TaxID=218851 RepID=A0A2G5ETN5_AQUCA|nr:hypothetical protein AQUCO_00400154v1 [Aquilegia coerulea]
MSEITLRPLDFSDVDDVMVWVTDDKVSKYGRWETYTSREAAMNYIKDIYWGQGIATKAVKLVVNCIFNEWPYLERLEALVDLQNIGSQKVLEKAGFQKEGVLRKYCILKGSTRDMVMYSFLSTDPKLE